MIIPAIRVMVSDNTRGVLPLPVLLPCRKFVIETWYRRVEGPRKIQPCREKDLVNG
jgi:hypothetical protein